MVGGALLGVRQGLLHLGVDQSLQGVSLCVCVCSSRGTGRRGTHDQGSGSAAV